MAVREPQSTVRFQLFNDATESLSASKEGDRFVATDLNGKVSVWALSPEVQGISGRPSVPVP